MKYHYAKGFEYFLHDPESGMFFFGTEKERDEYADKAIQGYMDEDGWHEDVTGIIAGKVTHSTKETDRVDRPADEDIDEEGCDGEGSYWGDMGFKCNYRLVGMDSAQVALNALTRGDLIHLYNSGYHAGHHDTVESSYTDIHQSDMDSYQEEIVDELLEDMAARGES